ncbi:MAG: peptide deformylase [Candidatus Tectomicrobia bacterium]|uniref:Peptide deformylase n=1 Tax=Tectimicrobiota bacterium TaxID=2528274 RepID=A0A932CP18_UNCTE|nr:peptide deformylase [Candidatus Tectomicrobia bacterium]
MPLLDIVTYPDPILRTKALPVTRWDNPLQTLINDMILTMYAAPGIGLAAPQVGISSRLFVIDTSSGRRPQDLIVLINPEILSMEGEIEEVEGCLSVPGIQEKTPRAARVTIQGLTRRGEEVVLTGEGLLARAFQHEMDHLEGKFFFERLGKIRRDLIKARLRRAEEVRGR